jgi:cell wall-associated NlpC family hydrolase/uncharacterized protein YukE
LTELTPDDVRRWDAAAVLKVFQVANGRADTMQKFGDDLGQVGQNLADWEGEAGAAFQGSLGRARTDIESDGRESRQVGAAVSDAWEDVQITRGMMSEVDETAQGLGFTITPDWKVDIGNAGLLMGTTEARLEQQILQGQLDTVKVKAHTTDHELATAMRAAVGDVKLNQDGREIPQAPAPPPSDKTVPGPRPGDPRYDYHDGEQHPPPTMIPGANVIPLADNPPGFPPVGPGSQRDQNWQTYLNGQNADGSRRVAAGVPPAALPNPEAVQDKGLQAIGAAGRQQGISYAWGGNQSPYGPTKGQGDGGGDATKNHDENRIGYDCGGLVRFSMFEATGHDAFEHNGPSGKGTDQLDSSKYLTPVEGGIPGSRVGQFAQPGDVLVFGDPGHQKFSGTDTHHTGIYLGNGVIINAPGSGQAVRVDPLSQWAREPTDILRPQ